MVDLRRVRSMAMLAASANVSPAVSDICQGCHPIACEGLHEVLTIPQVEDVDGVGRMI